MNANDFLNKILAEGNYYCLLALKDGGKQWENRKQLFYKTKDALVESAMEWDSRGWDTFYALGSFSDKGSRGADFVENVKAFFLDLDIGDNDRTKYPTREAALGALRDFCKQVSLPKPTIVDSGYGLHVYWALAEPSPVEEWKAVANRLKKLLVEKDMLSDPAVTSDAARVLRIPTCKNYKGDTPKHVSVLYEGNEVPIDTFAKLIGMDSIPTPVKDNDPISAFTEALIRNRENSFKDIILKTKEGKGCEQLNIIATDQANCSEPMWRAGLSIAKFCNDGEKAAHIISKGHAEYSPDQTQAKFDLIKGPYLCSTFDSNNEGICPECPHWGKLKSPISLGSRVAEATENIVHEPAADLPNAPVLEYVIPTYPKPYFRGKNGGVYVRTSNSEGDIDERLVYLNDLYVVRRLRDVEIGEAIVMRLHLPKDGVSEFTVPLTAVTSRDEFRKQMSMRGVAVTKMEELMQYTTTWVNELQASTAADEAHRQFGWTNDKFEAFILGNTEIKADKISFNPPSTQTAGLFPAFEPKGTIQGWKDTIDFYNRDGMELHQYVLGTAFGSVLMPFSPINCAAMHIHSKDTGLGKTTAMVAGASIWGNPEELIIQEQDTHATKMNRGEVYHNLPLYMDELTNSHGRELSDMAYQITSGKQRARMTSGANQERHRGAAWKLLAVTTGNTSLIERISMFKNMPKAEAQRVMECHVKKVHFDTKEETDKFSASLRENFGHAGIPYVQYIMNNVEECRRICKEMQARVDKLAGLTAENRYWSVHAAYTLSGLFIAKKLGLIDFDLKAIERWIIGQLRLNKATVSDMSVSIEQMLNDYMSENFNSMIWIKSTDRAGSGSDNGLDSLVIPDMMPRTNKLVGRYETDIKVAYLLPKPLKEWCGEQQINYGQLVQDMKDKLGAKRKKVRITRGTQMQLPPADCLVVKCDADIPEEVVVGGNLYTADV
jgi:hypothetical protein